MAKKPQSKTMTLMPKPLNGLSTLLDETSHASTEMTGPSDGGLDFLRGPVGVELSTDIDIQALIDQAIEERSLASKDLKFDDSSMPRAKNFLDWCTGKQFLNADPYLEQALIGIRLFAEYCPHCSDVEWMHIDNHEPQEGLEGLRQHVVCLEDGVCPKCGRHRADMLAKKELKFYNELAVNAGQRCVTGDTHVLTRNGIERIGAIGADRPYGFSNYCAPVFNGTEFETTSDFYRGREENVYALRLSNGYVLRGTRDHPVETTSGFKTLGAIAQGEVVPVHVNQQCWGTDIPTIEQLKLASEVMFNAKCASTPATNRAQVQNCLFGKARQVEPDLYKVLGFWVAEGRGGFISNMDPAVNEFVYSTLTRYMSKRYVRKYKTGVEVCGFRAKAWLAAALGTTVDDLTSGSAGKRVPDVVLRSPKEYVCSFLQGLFEGDGSCSTGTKRSTGSVSYASTSKTLAYDVYTILVNLGIMPSIRERMSWATNGSEKQESKPYWSVSFKSEQCVTRFYEQVGFFSNRKNTKLEKCLDRKRNTQAKNPVKCENYSFLKEEVKSALDSVQTQLNQFELNYAFRSNPEKFRRFKSKKRLGLFTVFGRMGSSVLGCRWDKLFSEDRALTKTKLKFICESILDFDSYLSRESVDKFKFWLDLCHTDTFLLRVKSCTVTADVEETFDFTLPETHKFVTQGVISHNSGKSFVVAMLSTYLTHWVLKSQKPTDVLGIESTTLLHGTFVALTQKQAMDTLWEPYYGYLLDSPWFIKYHALIQQYERKYGVEVMKIRDTFVLYRHRNLVVYPAGPDKRVLRGRTRIFAATDEIGWFDNNEASAKVKTSAREVHIALDRSLLTVRAEEKRQVAAGYDLAFTGYNFNISSPSHARDKINELVRLSQGSDKILGLHAPTWKMNPKISQESLAESFKNDPVGTWRDYGAVAPLSANPFISQHALIDNIIRDKGRNEIKYNLATSGAAKDGSRTRYGVISSIKESTRPSVLAMDAGFSNNSFALVLGEYDESAFIRVSLMVEIMPLPGVPLNYSLIYEHLILPIIKKRNVQVLLADRWQSIKLLQDASPHVEISKQYSLKYADFWTVKALMEQGTVSIPRPLEVKCVEDTLKFPQDNYPYCFDRLPVEHLLLQCATVQDSGSQILKGTGYTDDLWRAMCLMCWAFECSDFDEYLLKAPEKPVNRDPSRLGVVRTGRRQTAVSGSPTPASAGFVRSRR